MVVPSRVASQEATFITTAGELVLGGQDEVFQKLQGGVSHRKELEEMKKLAATVPVAVVQP